MICGNNCVPVDSYNLHLQSCVHCSDTLALHAGANQHMCNVKCLMFVDSYSSLFKICENESHHILLWTTENNGVENYFWLISRIVWR